MGADALESRAIFDAFAEAGGNFIDTAHVYSYKGATGEGLVGEFIRADRDHFVISTKYGVSTGTDLSNSGNSRKNMMRCVEESLRRLKSDYIDIYWLHAWEESTPLDEILRGFDDLLSSGKVHYIAASDTPAWQISRAVMLSELRGWSRFCGIEVEYNLLERTAERELLPMARELELAVCAWAPLAGGRLSGKYAGGSSNVGRLGDKPISNQETTITRLVLEIAAELGCRPSQVALSAIRQMARRNAVIPILGARTAGQIRENLGSLNIVLEAEQLHRLDEASAIDLGFPHTLLTKVRALSYSGKADFLDGLP